MRWDTEKERLRRIDDVIESIERAAEKSPILVEGRKDEKALTRLGIEGDIVRVSGNGRSLAETAERVSYEYGYDAAVLLTDWDSEGDALKSKLKSLLESHGVTPRTVHRKRLRSLTAKEIHDVESLHQHRLRMEKEI